MYRSEEFIRHTLLYIPRGGTNLRLDATIYPGVSHPSKGGTDVHEHQYITDDYSEDIRMGCSIELILRVRRVSSSSTIAKTIQVSLVLDSSISE